MRIKSIFALIVIGTMLGTVPLQAQSSNSTVTISQASASELVKLSEKAKTIDGTLHRTIVEGATLFSLPIGLTAIGCIVGTAIALAAGCCAGCFWACNECCN